MTYLEKYNRFIAEAKNKIGELMLQASVLACGGFDTECEVTRAIALQDALDFLANEYNTSTEADNLYIIDYYAAAENLVVYAVLI